MEPVVSGSIFKIYLDLEIEKSKFRTFYKDIIMEMERIDGILRLESMISLEESINDKKRLMKSIFSELKLKH